MQPVWLTSEVFSRQIQPLLAKTPHICNSITNWCLALVRWPNPGRLSPTPEALARVGGTCWDFSGISNPLEVIEQITYLLFLKRLDEQEIARPKGIPDLVNLTADFTGKHLLQ